MVAAHAGDRVDDFSARAVVPTDQLEIGDSWARIPYGTALDLGGCGKGFAGDMLADIADSFPELRGYWFSLGGDIVAAGCDTAGRPWTIGIENTVHDQPPTVAVTIAPLQGHYAVATSSIVKRTGLKDGVPWHHIIDPRTNQPAKAAFATASVSTVLGLQADVLASCLLLLPASEATAFAQIHGATGLLLQAFDGGVITWGAIHRAPTPA
jgi:FAD:protein FMN transferase